jgi:hypothetical protein
VPAARGCDTAPPFEDWVWTTEIDGELITETMVAAEAWAQLDADADPDELLADLETLGFPDLALWDATVRGGFHGDAPEETIAGIRIAAISAIAGVIGDVWAWTPADAWELALRSISGTRGVYGPTSPRTGRDYERGALQLLTRAISWVGTSEARASRSSATITSSRSARPRRTTSIGPDTSTLTSATAPGASEPCSTASASVSKATALPWRVGVCAPRPRRSIPARCGRGPCSR